MVRIKKSRAGKFYLDYFDPVVGGKKTRRTKLLRGVTTKWEAREWQGRVEARLLQGKMGAAEDEPTPESAIPLPQPPSVTIEPKIQKWLDSLKERIGYRSHRNTFLRARKHLLPFYKDFTSIDAIQDGPLFDRWMKHLEKKGRIGESTRRKCMWDLSAFLGWCVFYGFTKTNFVPLLPGYVTPQPAPRPVTAPWLDDPTMAETLMAEFVYPEDLMFYLGYRTGMRPGEVGGLRINDVDDAMRGATSIRVMHSYDGPLKEDISSRRRDQVGKIKWVPAPDDFIEKVGPYCRKRQAAGASGDDVLFRFEADSKPHTGLRPTSKSYFIKSMPNDMLTAEVVAKALEAGHQITADYVCCIRSQIARSEGRWQRQPKSGVARPQRSDRLVKGKRGAKRSKDWGGWEGYCDDYLNEQWKPIAAKHGIRMRLYDATRHTFVTTKIREGVSIEEIAAALGHSTTYMTKQYDHWIKKFYSDAIRAKPKKRAA